MPDKNQIKLFQNHKIRSIWREEKEEWYFSIRWRKCIRNTRKDIEKRLGKKNHC